MTATTTTPTIRDLLTFIHENPEQAPFDCAQEFGTDTVEMEEILNTLDERDGTLYYDDLTSTYRVEDAEASLEDMLESHQKGGGMSLDDELPVTKKEPKVTKTKTTKSKAKSQKEPKVKAETKTTATKTKTKRKAKAETPATPETEDSTSQDVETQEEPKVTKKRTRKKATTEKATKTTKAPKKPAKATKKAKVETQPEAEGEATPAPKKRGRKPKAKADTPKVEKEKKPRVVAPRASRVVEDATEAKKLGVDVGTEVKGCVDCKTIFPKFGGMFRPRWTDPEAKNEENPEAKAHPKHVQPRCIDCDKLRSRRKSRFGTLIRMLKIEDIGEDLVTHPDRKNGGVPDGKFSVAMIDDTVDGFTPLLRGALVAQAEGLIKIRWASGDNPEILGVTKKAIAACKAPAVTLPEPKVEKQPKAKKEKAPKAKATRKAKPKAETDGEEQAEAPKPKAKRTRKKATKAKVDDNGVELPW